MVLDTLEKIPEKDTLNLNIIPKREYSENQINEVIGKLTENRTAVTRFDLDVLLFGLSNSNLGLRCSDLIIDIAAEKPELFEKKDIDTLFIFFGNKEIGKNIRIAFYCLLDNKVFKDEIIENLITILDRDEITLENGIYVLNYLAREEELTINHLDLLFFKLENLENSLVPHFNFENSKRNIKLLRDTIYTSYFKSNKNTEELIDKIFEGILKMNENSIHYTNLFNIYVNQNSEVFKKSHLLKIMELMGLSVWWLNLPEDVDINIYFELNSALKADVYAGLKSFANLRLDLFDEEIIKKLSNEWLENPYLFQFTSKLCQDSKEIKFKVLTYLFPELDKEIINQIEIISPKDLMRLQEFLKNSNGSEILTTLVENFNISYFGRYPIEVLYDMYNQISENNFKTSNTIVWISAKTDWNGALHKDVDIFSDLHSAGFNILVFEVETDIEFESSLLRVKELIGEKLDYLIISGHGNPGSIIFGNTENEDRNTLDLTDTKEIEIIKETIKEEGTIILDSCSTASERETYNIAKHIHTLSGIYLIAPSKNTSAKQIYYEKEGNKLEIIGVEYSHEDVMIEFGKD